MKTISSQQVQASGNALLLDVRTPAEFEEVHIPGSILQPLSELQPGEIENLAAGRPVYVICRSGNRARQAAERLSKAGLSEIAVVDGGIQAWETAGLPVNRGKKTISLERQVRIAAGTLVVLGVVLSLTAHIGFLAISGFVGAGLVFSGITDTCGMAMILARMPWNRGSCRSGSRQTSEPVVSGNLQTTNDIR